jgi:hypothetical protein
VSVGLLKLCASGFAVVKSNLEIVAFNSAGIQLCVEISDSGVEMGNLFSKMMIGFLKLMASGLASS